jgi:CubicO group peptidase (beta-lactamase class C family)
MYRLLARAIALSLVLLCVTAQAQDRYEAEIRQLETFLAAEMEKQKIPGLSIAIIHGDFQWAKGFGYADLENKVPATAESSYRMASVTKPMTAAAVMRLVEEGKIDLDAEVQTYVDYFPRKKHPVTVRQLLQHLGGISHYKNYDLEGHIRDPKTTKEALAIFQDFDLVAEPGTRYSYSSYGYNLAGAVVEGACKCRFGDFMTEEVWKPLLMSNSRMDDPRAIIPHRVRGYTMKDGTVINSEYVDISSRFAAGGTRSTVIDMLKFATGITDGHLLKRESVEEMWTSGVTKSGSATRYGLGFGLTPYNGRFQVGHSGSQQETRTNLVWFPSLRFGYALASNFEDISTTPIENEIARLFLGDSWNLSYYTPKREDRAALLAMGIIWNNGLGYFDRHRGGRTQSGRELTEAFEYFNRAVNPSRLAKVKGDDEVIDQGRHPSAGEPFIKTGAYMAAALAKSGKDLNQYHREGEFAFFDDYINLYRTSREIPRAYRFTPAFEKQVMMWRNSWEAVWQGDMKTFSVSTAADLDRLAALSSRFEGRSVIPDYVDSLVSLGQRSAQRGEPFVAMRAAQLLLDLYPESADANGFAGVMYVVAGNVDGGRKLIEKSRAIDSEAYARTQNLKQIADVVEKMGLKEASGVLREFE